MSKPPSSPSDKDTDDLGAGCNICLLVFAVILFAAVLYHL